MSFCLDESEHRRQAQDDYRRGGRYGYDREEYRNPWNDCSDAYTREFDRLRREDDHRQEEREEERHAAYRRELLAETQREEEAYYAQAYPEPQYPEQEFPVECAHGDGRPAVEGHQLCEQCLGEIGADA